MTLHYLDAGPLSIDDSALAPIRHLCSVLQRRGSIRIVKELQGGYTGARVLLAEEQVKPDDPSPFSLVFKVGSALSLRDEVHRYRALLPFARAHNAFAHIIEPEKTLEALPGGQTGAIAYEHAAAPFARKDCISLKELVAQAIRGEAGLEKVEEVIAITLQAIGSLYAEPEPAFAFPVARYYLDRWAPHFHISIEEAIVSGAQCLLTQRRLNPAQFIEEPETPLDTVREAAESPSPELPAALALSRLSRVHTTERGIVLNGPTSDALSLELDLRALSIEKRESVEASRAVSLWAPASSSDSRYTFYRRRLQDAFPGRDLDRAALSIGGQLLQNPLRYISRPLVKLTIPPRRTYLIPAHGDLHPGNVLVVGNTPVIIDYGLAETRLPVGVDAARLFGGLVRDVLSATLTAEELTIILLSLFELEPSIDESAAELFAPWHLLKCIRDTLVRISDEDWPTLWALHLYGYSLVGLKWAATSSAQHRACGLLAAVTLTKLLGWPKPDDKSTAVAAPRASAAGPTKVLESHTEIAPEGPAEILILVVKFAGTAEYDPTARIYGALADHLFEVIPDISRVEYVDASVFSRKEAIALAQRFQASMIVWGSFDSLGIRPRYEVTRDSLVAKQSMIQLDEATRHKLKEHFDIYITDNLAAETSFLSLKAVGDICVLNLNHEAALGVYERALALLQDPDRVRALGGADIHQALAGVYLTLRRYDEAQASNAQACAIAPDGILAKLQTIMIRAQTAKFSAIQLVGELIPLLRQQKNNPATEPKVRDGLARTLEALEAIKSPEDLKDLLGRTQKEATKASSHGKNLFHGRQFKKDVFVHIGRAERYYSQNQFRKALKEYRSALRLNPRCAPAHVGRANVLAVLDRVPEALRELDLAEKIDPGYAAIYVIRADICGYAGNYDECLANVDKAMALGTGRTQILSVWGWSMIELGRGDQMMSILRNEEINPAQPELFGLRARYYRARRQYGAALREINQAVAIKSDDCGVNLDNLLERAEIYAAMSSFELAEGDARDALVLAVAETFAHRKASELLQELAAMKAGGKHSPRASVI